MKSEEREELKVGKEDSEENDLEKSIKEQKEILQALQTDINNVKGSLHGIESTLGKLEHGMERTKFFNFWYVPGNLCIAGGLAIICIDASLWNTGSFEILKFLLALVGGFLMFFAGVLMISGVAWTDVNRYPVKILKELQHNNRQLFGGILLIVIDILVLIVFSILSGIFYFLIVMTLIALVVVWLFWLKRDEKRDRSKR